MSTKEYTNCFAEENYNNDMTAGRAAMLLALSWNMKMEEEIKKILDNKPNLRYVVTEVGGKASEEFRGKIIKASMNAAINKNIIGKNAYESHALLHALSEAKAGVTINSSMSVSFAMKVAIVRSDHWIAVAMFGQSAFHPMTNHERGGFGIMHI